MPRYDHWVEVPRQRYWPCRVAFVDADETDVSEVDDNGIHHPSLTSVWWTTLVSKVGEYEYRSVNHAANAEHFWQVLRGLTAQGRSTLIMSQNTLRLATMVGLWQRLESGDLLCIDEDMDCDDQLIPAAIRLDRRGHAADKPYSCSELYRQIEHSQGYLVLSGPPVIMRLRLKGCKAWFTWVDCSNYGLEPLPSTEHPTSRIGRLVEWYKRYYQYCREYRLGKHCTTAGGQAYYGFKHSYYGGNAHVTAEPRLDTDALSSYSGGRAEAYRLGLAPCAIWYFDFRSAYPSVCRSIAVPLRHRRSVDHCGNGAPPAIECQRNVAALVTIKTDRAYYPLRRGGITIYPIGRFRTWLCGPELELAVAYGHVERWHRFHEFDCEPMLKDYAEAIYGLRTHCEDVGDTDMAATAKLMLNTLVGRFAMRDTYWTNTHDIDCELTWGEYSALNDNGELALFRVLGGKVQEMRDRGFVADALPWVAAWICSQARVNLIKAIEVAGWQHVYYVDADAVMVDACGAASIVASPLYAERELGKMSLRWQANKVELRGIKYYVKDGEVTCAGVPKAAIAELVNDDCYWRETMPMEDVRRAQAPTSATTLQTYRRDVHYRHGVVNPDGSVSPFILDE